MNRETAENVLDALRHCVKNECSDDCPMKDKDWITHGRAACRQYAAGETVEIPTILIKKAIGWLEMLDGEAIGGDA